VSNQAKLSPVKTSNLPGNYCPTTDCYLQTWSDLAAKIYIISLYQNNIAQLIFPWSLGLLLNTLCVIWV